MDDIELLDRLVSGEPLRLLRVDAPAGVPRVNADLRRIERVLDNLISNALQNTPGEGAVSVGVGADGSRVLVRVAATGIGIAPADLPHIFDRFYRVDRSRERACGGAGLGLAIARRIVELHGDTITVESGLQVGSSFCFGLPVYVPA